MNLVNAPRTIQQQPRSTSWSRLNYVFLTLCATLYLLPFMRLLQSGADEGTVIYGAERIVHGQVFARDFFDVMGPGTFYLLAVFFKILGTTFLATRVCLFIISLGTGVLMYFLSCRVCERYRWLPCIILACTSFGGFWPGSSYHVDGNFFALSAVACVVLWRETSWSVLLVAAGVLAGLTTCFLQPKGGLILIALLVWLWIQRHKGAASISSMGLVVGGYLGATGAAAAYFWSQGALGSLYFANVVWPSRHYGTVNSIPYAQGIIAWNWDHLIMIKNGLHGPAAIVVIGIVVILITPLFFVAALPVLTPLSALFSVLASREKWRIMTPIIMLYGLCGVALWMSEMHRLDINHLVFGSPLLMILFTYCMEVTSRKYADWTLQLVAMTCFWLGTFNFLGALTAHSIATPIGSVAIFKDDPVLRYIVKNIAVGEEMFVYPYHPAYYFLSSTINPTRYSLLMYNYNTDEEFYDAIRSIEQSRTRYVIWDTGLLAYVKDYFPTSNREAKSGLIMEPYLESHYKVLKEIDGVRIMERK
ncbi:MAG: hypothetical protein ABSB60_13550 [Terracidiphilus sp.]